MKMTSQLQQTRRVRFLPAIMAIGSIVVVASLLTSCVVTSVYPFYTAKNIVFDQALLGDWIDAVKTNAPNQFVRVERLGEKGYLVTAFTESETNSTEAYLFRLKEQLFLDVFPTNRPLDYLPVHQVSRVISLAPKFESTDLNYDWLAKLLEQKPEAIRHLVLPDKPGDTQGGRVVLTAETPELQRFVLKHLDNTNAWKEPSLWKHR